jgi:hypothetical protein
MALESQFCRVESSPLSGQFLVYFFVHVDLWLDFDILVKSQLLLELNPGNLNLGICWRQPRVIPSGFTFDLDLLSMKPWTWARVNSIGYPKPLTTSSCRDVEIVCSEYFCWSNTTNYNQYYSEYGYHRG